MSVQIIAILVLLIMFIITAALPSNLGILGFVAAFLVGTFIGGMSIKEIYSVFPADLFITLAGVTYLFAIVQNNGTIDFITRWGLRLVKGNIALIPWIMFALSTLLTSVGTLGPASVAIFAPIALRFAAQYRISPLLMGLMVVQGSTAGSYSPINPLGVIVNGILVKKDLPCDPVLLFVNALIFSIVISGLVFVLFGGIRLLKISTTAQTEVAGTVENDLVSNEFGLTWYKGATLMGLGLLIVLALGFGVNIGFAAFAVGLTLALMAPKKQSGVLERMPWSVILLISGVVTYVGVLDKTGTIDYVTELIAKVGNPLVAALAASYVGGLVSSFASTTGILAAIIPMAAPIMHDPSISAIGVLTAIAIASIIVDLSPFSTNGALLLANVQGVEERVFFKQILLVSVATITIGPGLAWIVFVLIGIP